MNEDGVSISKQKNLIQINESCSSTQISSENIIREQETVSVRNDEEGIEFSHIRYFPKKPTIDLSKVDFKLNSDNFYDTNTFPRGTLTIINVNNFMKSSGRHDDPRLGTDVDAQSLCDLFLKLGFKIDRLDNPKSTDVLNILKQAANEDYSSMSCCVVALLSHGEEGKIFCTNESLNIREITNLFCTNALAGKPKLFLIQACRGTKYMESIDTVDGFGPGLSNESNVLDVTVESDFLYAYSTVQSYYSWRNQKLGSWFINAVVSVFRDYAHKMDVLRLLTRVNKEVSKKTSITDNLTKDNKKQIGSLISLLRKELFFFPYDEPMESV
ncbi:caspase-3-like [Hydra vulgaris]|uniref:Caspase 3C n=1 Tax=Hydra vulgaris TaxID=6087 RepID=Q5D0W5_HYDVU|nr:caspase-3-like [Hydra vulgaris]AAX18880.1 caspase 3C [Hydra vulgaris]